MLKKRNFRLGFWDLIYWVNTHINTPSIIQVTSQREKPGHNREQMEMLELACGLLMYKVRYCNASKQKVRIASVCKLDKL